MVIMARVLMLVDNEYGVGTFWRAFNIAKELANQYGYDTTIMCLSRKRINGIIRHRENNVEIMEIPRSGFASIPIRVFYSIFSSYNIIHAFATVKSSVGFSVIMARFLTNKCIIADWDDWWTRGGLMRYSRLVDYTHRFLEERVPLLADAVIVVSDALFYRALSLGVKKYKLFKVVNGSDPSAIPKIPKDEARRVLGIPTDYLILTYTGLSIHSKEFFTFIKAFKDFVKSNKKALLLLMGTSPQVYNAYLTKLGLSNNVLTPGFVSRDKYLLYLIASDAFILPADPVISEIARFPIRLGDYLAVGRPIIASDVGEVGRLIRECNCGFVVKPGDVESWLMALNKVSISEDLRNMLGSRARETAEAISWRNIASQINFIYSRICGKSLI